MRRFDLRSLRFAPDDHAWRRLPVDADPFVLGGQEYAVEGRVVEVSLDATRVGGKIALQIEFDAVLHGPCQRCLEDARLDLHVLGADYVIGGESQGADDGEAPYVLGGVLEVDRWVRDLLGSALPPQIVCREECRGLCPVCGVNLNQAGDDHSHEPGAVSTG